MRVDLNSDLGEGGDQDEALLEFVTSANIACGFHAGDPGLMRRTIRTAARKGVGIGAHPGFRDLEGFGRRAVTTDPGEIFDLTLYQVGALQALAAAEGQRVVHVKPHGALYNLAARDAAVAEAVVGAVRTAGGLTLFGLAGSELVKAGRRAGLAVAEEAFADRGYQSAVELVPRDRPGAIVHDPGEAARRAVRLVKEGKVLGVGGTDFGVRADTICVHGDTPGAAAIVRALREALPAEGIELKRFGAP